MAAILRVRDADGKVSDIPAIRGKSAYQYAVEGGYTGTEQEFSAKMAQESIPKNQGAANVGKILVVGTDGNLTLADLPEGGAGGDVVGVLDESNNILLSGNLADGTYTLKYENADGTYTEIGSLVVGTGPTPGINLLPTLTDIDLVTLYNNGTGYKTDTRVSVSAISESNPTGEKAVTGVALLGLTPIGSDGDVFHFRNAVIYDANVSSLYSGLIWYYDENGALLQSKAIGIEEDGHTIGTDTNGDATITMNHSKVAAGTAYIRFNICNPTGEFIMSRNQLIPLD